jgi:hypothetical protein
LADVRAALHEASEVHGTFLFGTDHFFGQPLKAGEKAAVIKRLKALMQQTHPDKAPGFEDEFKRLNTALDYCRSTLNLLKTPEKRLAFQ